MSAGLNKSSVGVSSDWGARPYYADGTPMEVGDTIVLVASRDTADPNTGFETLVSMRSDDGNECVTLGAEEQEPAHLQVQKKRGKLRLVDQATGIPLSLKEDSASADKEDAGDSEASNVGFDSDGHMYFGDRKEPLTFLGVGEPVGTGDGTDVRFEPVKIWGVN